MTTKPHWKRTLELNMAYQEPAKLLGQPQPSITEFFTRNEGCRVCGRKLSSLSSHLYCWECICYHCQGPKEMPNWGAYCSDCQENLTDQTLYWRIMEVRIQPLVDEMFRAQSVNKKRKR